MSDFHQTGGISTLHRFHTNSLDHLEGQLTEFASKRPISLVIPALYSDVKRDSMKRIVGDLKHAGYLHQVVISLCEADRRGFDQTAALLSALPQDVRIVWNSGERIRHLQDLLKENGFSIGPAGKGRAVWMALGYVLAGEEDYLVALHDSDIITYDREIVARLCYPIANPDCNYSFCKGYYSRVSDRIYGRATRLFIGPLLQAVETTVGHMPLLSYLRSFRYPLAGEFSMTCNLARIMRIDADWGFDFGLLVDIYRKCSVKRICQVDLADSYDHKHQSISAGHPEAGLFKMSIDITRVLFRTLASEGVSISEGLTRSLAAAYLRRAEDTVKKYDDDAAINNLPFDRNEEGVALLTFAEGLRIGGESFLGDPLGNPEIPNWTRITSTIPEFLSLLKQSVDEDNL
jgi:glucosyl-3-phosphoglycerate synthase